jgi:hypothetical protein
MTVIASRKKEAYIFDLAEKFTNMCETRLKFNPQSVYLELQRERSLTAYSQQKASRQTPIKSELSFKCNLYRAGKTFKSLHAK